MAGKVLHRTHQRVIEIQETCVTIHYNDPYHTNVWYPVTIIFVVMGLPLPLISTRLAFPLIALTALCCLVGIIAGALSAQAYFPFCQLKTAGFAAPLIVFTSLAGLLALYAMRRTFHALAKHSKEQLERQRRHKHEKELSEGFKSGS
jgi:hypothetical protein